MRRATSNKEGYFKNSSNDLVQEKREKIITSAYFILYMISSNKYTIYTVMPRTELFIEAHADRYQLHRRRHKHQPTGMENDILFIKCKKQKKILKEHA